jgi:hypothetical protein
MARRTVRTVRPVLDVDLVATTNRDWDIALMALRGRRGDPCAERIAIELQRQRTPAELALISEGQADTLGRVIELVSIELTPEQRRRADEILQVELRRAAGEERG